MLSLLNRKSFNFIFLGLIHPSIYSRTLNTLTLPLYLHECVDWFLKQFILFTVQTVEHTVCIYFFCKWCVLILLLLLFARSTEFTAVLNCNSFFRFTFCFRMLLLMLVLQMLFSMLYKSELYWNELYFRAKHLYIHTW